MSVFAAKILTLLGYVLYAGGPIDAVNLAMRSTEDVRLAAVHQGVECVAGCDSEAAARVVAGPVRIAQLIISDEAKMPVLRSSSTDFGDPDFGDAALGHPGSEHMGVVE